MDAMGMFDSRGSGLRFLHNPSVCEGRACCIHNPSDHPLSSAPLVWRGHVMERTCPHGIGHPDRDDSAWREREGMPDVSMHGCDGCCYAPPPFAPRRKAQMRAGRRAPDVYGGTQSGER